MGFVNINSVKKQITIKGIEVNITKSKHGTGIIGKMMGKSHGFVIRTLDKNGINKILEKTPSVKLIVNHMDAWNHCSLTKEEIKNVIRSNNIFIPSDRETINI